MLLLLTLLLHLHAEVLPVTSNVLKANCKPEDDICELPGIVIETRQTMTMYRPGDPNAKRVVETENKGSFVYHPNCTFTNISHPLKTKDFKNVNFADGSVRYITTINGQFPGPTFVVYEGQTVRINVTNKFKQQGTSIHFHGQFQKGTPWMDGVTGLSQCAINAGETFTYNFTANPVGTFFYHSHTGLQRDDGLQGGFIVWPKPKNKNDADPTNELLMMVDDFYPLSAVDMFSSLYYHVDSYLYPGCMNDTNYREDSSGAGVYQFYSALVNGKGRRYDNNKKAINDTPLEIYKVKHDTIYKFRLISLSSAFAFKISIDGHQLEVTHTETGPIEPQMTDSVIVNVAERFEFNVKTKSKSKETEGNYWIRVETLETKAKRKDGTFFRVPNLHFTLAILRYDGAEETEPTTKATKCTQANKCDVVNCPFRSVKSSIFNCINVCDLKLRDPLDFPLERLKKVDKEAIFHFKFTPTRRNGTTDKDFRASINGRMFILPLIPPAINFNASFVKPCDPKRNFCKSPKACRCTNEIKLGTNKTIQFTLYSTGSHPIHLHGHSYFVVKVGYPKYNPSNNDKINNTADLRHRSGAYWNKVVWSNSTWRHGNIPGRNLKNPVRKDVVAIPAGGYVVIRFISDNPGWWFFHCHIDVHLEEGMALMVTEGRPWQFRKLRAPKTMHTCGNTFLPKNESEAK